MGDLKPRSDDELKRFFEWLGTIVVGGTAVVLQPNSDLAAVGDDASGANQRERIQPNREIVNHMFDTSEFHVIVEYLHETKEQRTSNEQRELAGELGVKNMNIFLEFRRELRSMNCLFKQFDVDHTGYLNKNEAWAALHALG